MRQKVRDAPKSGVLGASVDSGLSIELAEVRNSYNFE